MRLSAVLMLIAIIGIATFQCYWLKNQFSEEWMALKRETDLSFKDVVYRLQVQRFQRDILLSRPMDTIVNLGALAPLPHPEARQHLSISVTTTMRQDSGQRFVTRSDSPQKIGFVKDIFFAFSDSAHPFKLRYSNDSTPFPTPEGLDSLYGKELTKNKIFIPRLTIRYHLREDDLKHIPGITGLKKILFISSPSKSFIYEFQFKNPLGYILSRLKLQILMAVLLVGFTTLTFIFLYRNLRQQQQLAAIKNEFISNMTHELKTPISTVKVAVEALRHFDALDDPQRTREYLDISALELQRLSMLVDKVLKLSLFENKAIELNKSSFDLHELAAEVVASMKLQIDKAGAIVQLTAEGESFIIKADRTHMSSVISNLLDNALKYGKEAPVIAVHLSRSGDEIVIVVSDNGIGIPAAYVARIFDKFFRVPTGDHHNIKGYGLGLSYVHHIVSKHDGVISVESKEGKGSTFIIKLPVI
ncbi:MAG: HAMP domain-containing histidine kinase [Bacteroidetes bacterium]|nr:HAMP domain-containing histidine kinase [Bacteroidota bacterium]